MHDLLPTPAVTVDLDQVDANIRDMVARNAAVGIKVRPHIKAHKSVSLARRQLELGCQGITCAKLGEAEVMADHGITDILIAFPLIGFDKMERLSHLLDKADVLTIVNSLEGARQLSEVGSARKQAVKTLIELDSGIRRGGIEPLEPAVQFARAVSQLPGLAISGVLYFGGAIYQENDMSGFERLTRLEQAEVTGTVRLMEQAGFRIDCISGGNSFAAKLPHLLNGLTEVRPGNFIFNDCNQLSTGMATEEQCCLRIVATVVSIVDESHAIIDAGSKTLTSDLCKHRPGFGAVVGRPDLTITHLNEEHGFVAGKGLIGLSIGDRISIIPNHACVIPNLNDAVYGLRQGHFDQMIAIEARGRNR